MNCPSILRDHRGVDKGISLVLKCEHCCGVEPKAERTARSDSDPAWGATFTKRLGSTGVCSSGFFSSPRLSVGLHPTARAHPGCVEEKGTRYDSGLGCNS